MTDEKLPPTHKNDAFRLACLHLRDALDAQDKDARSPSMNVRNAIRQVLSYDPAFWSDFGRAVAEAVRD